VVLDYEASGLNVYHHDYFVMALLLKGETTQVTVSMLCYIISGEHQENFPFLILKAKIGIWLLSKKLVVFHLQYECAASLSYFGVS
jgi:hypothetical protein